MRAQTVTHTRYALTLGALTGLFTLRVAGQGLVAFLGVEFLPPMEQWYSGVMPYPILLPTQLAMIVVMVVIVGDVARGSGTFAMPRRWAGPVLLWCSYAYAAAMAVRYVVNMTLHPERRWFSHTIPIWFHVVLAAFLYTLGRYHVNFATRPSESGRRP
ncbi:MAG: hypothetical protein ACOYXR_00490 [Nitrospirota bacterium]